MSDYKNLTPQKEIFSNKQENPKTSNTEFKEKVLSLEFQVIEVLYYLLEIDIRFIFDLMK